MLLLLLLQQLLLMLLLMLLLHLIHGRLQARDALNDRVAILVRKAQPDAPLKCRGWKHGRADRTGKEDDAMPLGHRQQSCSCDALW